MRIHLDIGRKCFGNVLEVGFNIFGNTEGVDVWLLGDGENDRRLGIAGSIAHLGGIAHTHLGHIAETYGMALMHGNERGSQLVDIAGTAHTAKGILVAEVTYDTTGGVGTDTATQRLNIGHSDTVGLHTDWVGKNLVLLIVATDDSNLRDTTGAQDGRFNNPLGNGAEFLLGGGIGDLSGIVDLKTDKEDFAHHTALWCQNRSNAFGQLLGKGGHLLADYLTGAEDIHSPVEFDKDKAGTRQGSGAYPADIGGTIDSGFDGEGDEAFHLFGGHTVGIGHNHHLRGCEVWEYIDIRTVGRPQSGNHQQDGRHKDEEFMV